MTDDDGRVTPFVVAGQGGYHNLHKMATLAGKPIVTPYTVDAQTVLNSYCDDRFGFMRLEASAAELSVETYTVPRPGEKWSMPPQLIDRLRFDWKAGRIIP